MLKNVAHRKLSPLQVLLILLLTLAATIIVVCVHLLYRNSASSDQPVFILFDESEITPVRINSTTLRM